MHARWVFGASLLLTGLAVGSMPSPAGAAGLPGNSELGGYQVANPPPGPGGRTSVQAQFTVPAVTCTDVNGVLDATTEIVATSGDSIVAASVLATCTGGSPTYQAAALGVPLSMTVTPGNKMVLRVFSESTSQAGPGYGATVDNRTTGVDMSMDGPTNSSLTVATVSVGVVPDAGQPVPDFGKLRWKNAFYDTEGHSDPPLGSADPQGFALVSSSKHPKHLMVSTSSLSTSGASFTNFWDASS